ncbi:hypothetical protein ACVWWJ_002693 [Luteibacter sp. HA06]
MGATACPRYAGCDRTIAQFAALAWTLLGCSLTWWKFTTETGMSAPNSNQLAQTTISHAGLPRGPAWWEIIMSRDIVRFRRAVKRRAALVTEGHTYKPAKGPLIRNLTPAALATLADADFDGLLMLPLALYLGGDIGQIDSEGRTLLHLARTRRVARYLIEEGVPVADGMRDALIKAFNEPPGKGTFARGTVLGMQDAKGNEPAILAAVRRGTAARHATPESVLIPKNKWQSAVHESVYNGMLGIGYNERYEVRKERDPFVKANRPELRAELSATFALSDAVEGRDGPRLRACLALGADPSHGQFIREVPGGRWVCYMKGLSALAAAAMDDCRYIDHVRDDCDGDDPARDRPVPERELLLPHFARFVDFSGVHGPDGMTLMHLAREAQVAQWLVDHGAPCDVPDSRGKLPWEVLPPEVAATVNRKHLESNLPKATRVEARTARRL